MAIVAGVDFGTLSVRVTLFDSAKGRLGQAACEYPLHRRPHEPEFATQSHRDHMRALGMATREVLRQTDVDGANVEAIALDTTGSSVVIVDEHLQPLDDYYLWCDHRAHAEALEITATARAMELEAIAWCGGTYSHEWGWSKLLHWLRHASPAKQASFATALEHCDMVAATLSGVTSTSAIKRSICAMGHKWMWNPRWGGFPPEEFWVAVDPVLRGVRAKIAGDFLDSRQIYGGLHERWAEELGLRAGIPIPVGALDAHWDALGAGCREGDVVNVIGTSTCIIAMSREMELVPGVCGIVPGSVDPDLIGIEAGLSAAGDIFDAIARRSGVSVKDLATKLEGCAAGHTGLLRFSWDNGDRTVLVNADLGGITLGWNLMHTPEDELFAAIEGTAFHTRIILERMAAHHVPVRRVIQAGGIPQNNEPLNQVYANVLNKPVLVPEAPPTGTGAAIFAFLAVGHFDNIDAAQQSLCANLRTYTPEPVAVARYERLYQLYRKVYFALGTRDAAAVPLGDVLPELSLIAREARANRARESACVP
jgi:L-ribulokinase